MVVDGSYCMQEKIKHNYEINLNWFTILKSDSNSNNNKKMMVTIFRLE